MQCKKFQRRLEESKHVYDVTMRNVNIVYIYPRV